MTFDSDPLAESEANSFHVSGFKLLVSLSLVRLFTVRLLLQFDLFCHLRGLHSSENGVKHMMFLVRHKPINNLAEIESTGLMRRWFSTGKETLLKICSMRNVFIYLFYTVSHSSETVFHTYR